LDNSISNIEWLAFSDYGVPENWGESRVSGSIRIGLQELRYETGDGLNLRDFVNCGGWGVLGCVTLYKKAVCWRTDKGKPCAMKLVLTFHWRHCHRCLQHFCIGVTPTSVSGCLISRYRRDAYCCVRPADQQIPSWRLLLCPALWSADTVMTRKLLCPVLWSADTVMTRKLLCPALWSADTVMTRKLLCPALW
jgi:hypothetical protein